MVACLLQGFIDAFEQRSVIECSIFTLPIDKERRSAIDAAPNAAHEIRFDGDCGGVVAQSCSNLVPVEAKSGCKVVKQSSSQVSATIKEKIVHLPEPALRSCVFGQFCSRLSPRMDLTQWEVPEYKR